MRTLVLLSAAVAATAHGQLSRPEITTQPNGTVRVVNTGPSRWEGTSGWRLELERTITPEDGSPGMISRPYGLAVDRQGRIIVSDWEAKGLLVFDSDGKFLRSIGGIGQGPGEFQPGIQITARGDTVGGYSPNNARALVWRTDGTSLGQWNAAPCCASGPVTLDGRGGLLVPTWIRSGDSDRPGLVRWSFRGETMDTVLLPPSDPRVKGWPAGRGMMGIPFQPSRSGAFDSRLRYIHGLPTSYTLVVAEGRKDTARVITLPGRRVPVQPELRDSIYQRAKANPRITVAVLASDLPEQHPYFTRLLVDESDNVWIARPGPRGATASFDVVDRDGRFLGTVTAPPGMESDPVFARGRMYRFTENADGVPVIEVYRVNRGRS